MLYFAYKENGDFNGFYSDDIHEEIPKNNLKINEELWQELLKDNYKVNLEVLLNLEDRILTLEDKDNVFIRLEMRDINTSNTPSTDKILLNELAKTKMALMAQQDINKKLLEESSKAKISAMQQQEVNKNLLKSIAELKINSMKGSK